MTLILDKRQIMNLVSRLSFADLLNSQERAFRAFSQKEAVLAPVGHLGFSNPSGSVHIKSGYLQDGNHYAVKIVSGFPENRQKNFSSSNGLILLFQQKTGVLDVILLDEGYLTEIRTALAGAVVAKYLAPKKVRAIGIVGDGSSSQTSTAIFTKRSGLRSGSGVGAGSGESTEIPGRYEQIRICRGNGAGYENSFRPL